jgi:hypothetical protein
MTGLIFWCEWCGSAWSADGASWSWERDAAGPGRYAQAVQYDAQAGFQCPARLGVLGQGADHRQQLGGGQVAAERGLLPCSLEQAGEAGSCKIAAKRCSRVGNRR